MLWGVYEGGTLGGNFVALGSLIYEFVYPTLGACNIWSVMKGFWGSGVIKNCMCTESTSS
jgi:hypothetical protein